MNCHFSQLYSDQIYHHCLFTTKKVESNNPNRIIFNGSHFFRKFFVCVVTEINKYCAN